YHRELTSPRSRCRFHDDEPVNPEPTHVIHHRAPASPEGYINDDDMEDDEEDPDEDPKEEPIKQDDDEEVEEDRVVDVDDKDDEEIEVDEEDEDDGMADNEDEAEVINAYEEFGHNFHVGEGLSARALLAGNIEVNAPGPIACNLESVCRVAARLDKQMLDRYRTEKKLAKKFKKDEFCMNGHEYDITTLDEAVRKNSSEHSKMKKFVLVLSMQYNKLKEQNRQAKQLSCWELWVRGRIPVELRFEEEPPIYTTFVPHADDPYVMVRDAALAAREDEDDDITAPRDPQPSKPHGSPLGDRAAIRAERERVREKAPRAGSPTGDLAAALVDGEYFWISECTERRKVKFTTAILHGRALTWWNSQVSTLGLKVANQKLWAEVKTMMIDEFCQIEEVRRLEDELRHLKLRDTNIAAYTERFNELALLCLDVVPNEKKKVKLYIKGETTSSRPAMLNDAEIWHFYGRRSNLERLLGNVFCSREGNEVNNNNNVNIVISTVNATGTNRVNVVGELPFDPDMPDLEDIGTFDFSNKDEVDDAVADMNNLDTTIQVSLTLTTRIHKDYPLDQLIGDLHSVTQTRNMSKNLEEHSKAFRVFNSRTRIMEENFHIRFSESTPDVVGTKASDNAGQARKETKPDDGFKPSSDNGKKVDEDPSKGNEFYDQEKEIKLTTLTMVDGKKVIISEASIRRDLHFADEERVYFLPRYTIFEQLASMGNLRRIGKGFSGRITPLFPTMVVQSQLGEGSTMPTDPHHTPAILQTSSSQLQKTYKHRKPKRKVTQVPQLNGPTEIIMDEAFYKELDNGLVRVATTTSSLEAKHDNGDTTAQTRVIDLEKIKTSQANEIESLKRRVKKLERMNMSRTYKLKRLYKVGLTARVESSYNEESLGEDASKQGQIESIDADEDITLVNVQADVEMFDADKDLGGEEVFVEQEVVANKRK
nr:putative reverse transcriptase domain-containing protein [Tanacetum cinerariifolium]